jgi:hypothetical protein
MPRCNGSYIGFDANPNANAASGMWTVREAETYLRADKWPATPTVPGAPTPVAGDEEVSLTWTAPTGGSTTTDYVVQYSSDGGANWTTFTDGVSTNTSATVTGLTNGATYIFRIQAINALGAGPFGSASGNATPFSDPDFPASDLLAFWKLADTSDSSGNDETLTNNDSVDFVAGKIGNAAEFSGSNHLSRSMTVDFSADFSISLWCKPTDVASYGVLIIGHAANTFAISYTGSNSIDINNAAAAFLNVAADADEWHHVVVTRNATTTKVWLNGALAAEDDNQGTGSASSISLGKDGSGGGSYYTGLLDAVGIWDRILSDSEIADLWNSGSGLEP